MSMRTAAYRSLLAGSAAAALGLAQAQTAPPERTLERAVTSEISTGSRTLDVLLDLPPGALGASEPGRGASESVPRPRLSRGEQSNGQPLPVRAQSPEILDKADTVDADRRDGSPDAPRREWTGSLGGGIGTREGDQRPGWRNPDAALDDDNLLRLLPRSTVLWLKENREWITAAAVATLMVVGVIGWLRDRGQGQRTAGEGRRRPGSRTGTRNTSRQHDEGQTVQSAHPGHHRHHEHSRRRHGSASSHNRARRDRRGRSPSNRFDHDT